MLIALNSCTERKSSSGLIEQSQSKALLSDSAVRQFHFITNWIDTINMSPYILHILCNHLNLTPNYQLSLRIFLGLNKLHLLNIQCQVECHFASVQIVQQVPRFILFKRPFQSL